MLDGTFLDTLGERFATYAPTAGLVLGVVIGGWVASAVARRVVATLVRKTGLEALAERAGVARALYAVGVKKGLASFLGSVTFAAGLVTTFTVASDVLGLTIVSRLTTDLLGYLPRLLGACALLLGSGVIASIVRAFVDRVASKRSDVESPKAAAKVAYAFVLAIGVMLAAEQAGLEVAFLTTLLQIAVGLLGFAFALTFAFGFHSVFRSMAARHYYRPLLRVGDVVKIGEDEGTVVRFGPTALVLRTTDGDRIVPCSRFLNTTIHVRAPGDVPRRGDARPGA